MSDRKKKLDQLLMANKYRDRYKTASPSKQQINPDAELAAGLSKFRKQIIFSVLLFSGLTVLATTQTERLVPVQSYVVSSFEQDLPFDYVAELYEEQFGRPFALLPPQLDEVAWLEEETALPVTGVVSQTFADTGRGVEITTESGQALASVKSGVVTYVGMDLANNKGQLVIVTHRDGTEAWYGMLDAPTVQVEEEVEAGQALGSVYTDGDSGIYYYATKQHGDFVDPLAEVEID
ncbi:M23 family metallopeptidase [Paenalkalicoccus suaedae]|uniref:M23 family metallopeptidase n=1 Tax=Paenalkalicoccus suaedae TaxID=2592382 RepID=A0A859FG91_9BACI|nr:M23 family metallopeptidase [Paenalkalicoccus suaedae]QKS71838.1 M23 family metallopeptidase [Paenalkalicoccus suaedae]